jgi:hypothetical protein
MADEKQLYTDSWGTQILLETLAVNLDDVSAITIKIEKPDGVILEKIGYIESEDSVNVYYITEEGDIDIAGNYRFKAELDWVTPSKHLPTVPFTRVAKDQEF